jgi:hypothetical protein
VKCDWRVVVDGKRKEAKPGSRSHGSAVSIPFTASNVSILCFSCRELRRPIVH